VDIIERRAKTRGGKVAIWSLSPKREMAQSNRGTQLGEEGKMAKPWGLGVKAGIVETGTIYKHSGRV